MMMQATTSARGPSAAELIESFEKSEGLNDRIGILRQLAIVGREESVPLLTKLLDHEDEVIRGYALAAAESNPAPAAGAALVAALGKANDAAWKVAVINALGGRREPTAVAPLAALMNDGDAAVSSAAIAALGSVGTPAAGGQLGAFHWKLKGGQETGDKVATQRKAADVSKALLLCWERIEAGGEQGHPGLFRMVHGLTKGPAADVPEAHHLELASIRGFVKTGDLSKALGYGVSYLKSGTVREQAEAARILVDLQDEDRVVGPTHPQWRFVDVQQKLLAALPTLPATAQAFLLEALAEREAKRFARGIPGAAAH